ncbi:MAG: CoA ester lyase [Haloferacaceae archaeon]
MQPVRSLLYVPANRREWVTNAPRNDADGYIFDLEDAVPLDEKDHARDVLADALDEFGDDDGVMTVRVNPPDTGLFEADLEAIAHPRLDAVVVPKLPSPEDVRRTDHVLRYLESVRDIDDSVEIIALPETAQGFRRGYDLCAASDRVAALVGATSKGADVQRALGFEWTREGTEKRHLLSKVVMDGRAAGVDQLLSGPWLDVDDVDGLRQEAEMARQLGYTGYQIIHPSHAEPVNEIFLPDEEEVEECRALLEAVEDAGTESGRGAIRHEGEMVDLAHVRRAEDVLDRARSFGLVD